jgi:CRISPR-associated protein Cas1
MNSQVDVVFVSRRGSYLGQLVSGDSRTRVHRLRAQLAASDDQASCLRLAKAIAEAKVRKQIVLLQRFGRREHTEAVQAAIHGMRQVLLLVPDCTTPDEVRGVEGAAAREYFPALGALFPTELGFTHRSRQPPLDLPNSALSFLYTVLLGECTTALVAAGLDPAVGVFHADHETRPSLALDLMEELRPLVVDQVVLAAARKRELRSEHAWNEEGRPGVLLTKAGREVVLDGFERRMLQTTRGALPGFSGTLRRHVFRQAQRLAAAMARPDMPWTGLSWR